MRNDVRERRRKMCSMVWQGVDPYKAAEKLADEYGVKTDTVKQDWWNRENWITDVFEWKEGEDIIRETINMQKQVRREMWKIKRKTNQQSVKLGALKQIAKLNERILSMMQDVGKAHKEPEKHDVRHEHRIREKLKRYYDEETGLTVKKKEKEKEEEG